MVMGIDPGLSGGLVLLHDSRYIELMAAMPLNKEGEIDITKLNLLLGGLSERDAIIIEDVHSIFGASAKSNFMFGKVCGIIQALANTTPAAVHLIPPKAWQKKVWEASDIVLKNGKKDTKKTSLVAATRLATRLDPAVDFRKSTRSKIPHDGIVDAYLIAYSYTI